jgi:hypothetical protein
MYKDSRKQWQAAKTKMEKLGVKMTDIADKANFGPSLDDLAKAEATYDATDGSDPKKMEKVTAAYIAALDKALHAGGGYLNTLHQVTSKLHTETPQQMAAVKDAEKWLQNTLRIIQTEKNRLGHH